MPRGLVPVSVDLDRVCTYWDRAATLVPELLGQEPTPYAQRLVADRQIRFGYMHSGYPIMTFLDVVPYQMGFTIDAPQWKGFELWSTGAWGQFHELGHNYNQAAWTFGGGGEVTVNLFTLYVLEKLVGLKPLEHKYLKQAEAPARAYLAKPVWAEWSRNPMVALRSYAILAQEFGWAPFTATFRSYAALAKDRLPSGDQEKLDYWVGEFSRQARRNLVPYFRQWGWPVSAATETALRDLPVWKM
jgi:hypothetical protein